MIGNRICKLLLKKKRYWMTTMFATGHIPTCRALVLASRASAVEDLRLGRYLYLASMAPARRGLEEQQAFGLLRLHHLSRPRALSSRHNHPSRTPTSSKAPDLCNLMVEAVADLPNRELIDLRSNNVPVNGRRGINANSSKA